MSRFPDIIPIGFVDKTERSYITVDKIFYKVRIDKQNDLNFGDILYFNMKGNRIEKDSNLKKNVLFQCDSYLKIHTIHIRKAIDDRMENYDPLTCSALKRIIFDIYPSDETELSLGYGLFSYYFFKRIERNNRFLAMGMIFLFSFLFGIRIKYYLIVIGIICGMKNKNRIEVFALQIIFLSLLNPFLFHNNSVLLTLLFEAYGIFSIPFSFHSYLLILSSLLFGQSDLVDVFFFKQFVLFKALLFLASSLVLVFPVLSGTYGLLIRLFTYIDRFHLNIRGSISLPGFLLFMEMTRIMKNRGRSVEVILICICILLPLNEPFFQVSFIDVGQGDAPLIRYPFSHSCILIDTGPKYNYYSLQKELFKKGIYRIDHLIITHNDSDHNGNVSALLKDFDVKDIVEKGRDIEYRDLLFKFYDLGLFDNDNDNSLVYSLEVNGKTFLFTGDISRNAERILIMRYGPLNVDVLKVGHHGSSSSSSELFISEILPEVASISTSGMYDHPHKEVLEILDRYLVRYYVTARSGTISIYMLSGISFVRTSKNEFAIMR